MLPKTSALTTYELIQEFKKWVDKDYDVFFISISSSFSCSLQNAYIASQEFDGRVIAFDSKNLSTGIGLLVCKAIELKDKVESIKELEKGLLQVDQLYEDVMKLSDVISALEDQCKL